MKVGLILTLISFLYISNARATELILNCYVEKQQCSSEPFIILTESNQRDAKSIDEKNDAIANNWCKNIKNSDGGDYDEEQCWCYDKVKFDISEQQHKKIKRLNDLLENGLKERNTHCLLKSMADFRKFNRIERRLHHMIDKCEAVWTDLCKSKGKKYTYGWDEKYN